MNIMSHEEYIIQWHAANRIWRPDSFNCRSDFMLSEVEDLSKSIADVGRLITPLIVQPICDVSTTAPPGYDFRLISGYRRFLAITVFLQWLEIPCQILYGLDEHQARLINLVENLERKDLNPLEEAIGIRNIYPLELPSARIIGKEIKKDFSWVAKRLRILRLPEEVQKMIASKRIGLLDVEIIAARETPEDQIAAANALAESKTPKGCKSKPVAHSLTRSFIHPRKKTEINAKIEYLINLGVDVSGRRMAAWCAGGISDDDLEGDIQYEVRLLEQS